METGAKVVPYANIIVLDLDSSYDPETGEVNPDSAPTIEQVRSAVELMRLESHLYSSHSHRDGKNRFRLLIAPDKPIAANDLPAVVKYAFELLNNAGCPACLTAESGRAAQAWFLPAVASKDALFVSFSQQGARLSVADALAAHEKDRAVIATYSQPKTTGDDVIGKFNKAHSLADMLRSNGYQQKSERSFLAPSSTSGIAGVRILGDSNICFSHHGNDLLADGQVHDAFDLFKLFYHGGNLTAAVRSAAQELGISAAPANNTAPQTAVDVQWEKPTPLTAMTYPPEPTAEHMPQVMWNVIESVAEMKQARIAIAFPVALAAACTAIRGKLFVAREREPQREVVTLYTACIARSGEGKSSVRSTLLTECHAIEKRLGEEHGKAWRIWDAETHIADQSSKAIEKLAVKEERQLTEEEKKRLLENAEVQKDRPKSGLAIYSDCTPEALVEKMGTDGFVSIMAGEGASVTEGMGRYSNSKGSDLSPFLSAYDNESSKSARRKEQSYGSHNPRACIDLAMQPDVLTRMWGDEQMKGRGFINRLTMFAAKPIAGEVQFRNRQFNMGKASVAGKSWNKALQHIDAQVSKIEEDCNIRLSHDADELWCDFAEQWQPRVREGADLWHLADFFSKRMAAQVLRIAAIYHMVECHPIYEEISANTMTKAVAAGELIAEHFIAISKAAGFDPQILKAQAVLQHIKDKQLQEVTAKIVYDNRWAGCSSADLATETLEVLTDHHWLHRVDAPATRQRGRPTAPRYLVNLKSLAAKTAKTVLMQNETVGSGDNGVEGIKKVLAVLTAGETKNNILPTGTDGITV